MTQTYIAGIGASGALLAGAAVTLISLVGLVSFQVWPESPDIALPTEEVELNLPAVDLTDTDSGAGDGSPLSAAVGELTSISPQATGGTPGGPTVKPDRDPAPGGQDAPSPPPVSEPPEVSPPVPVVPVEPDSRAGDGDTGVGKDDKKTGTSDDRQQRPDFDEDEPDVSTPPKTALVDPDSSRSGSSFTDPSSRGRGR